MTKQVPLTHRSHRATTRGTYRYMSFTRPTSFGPLSAVSILGSLGCSCALSPAAVRIAFALAAAVGSLAPLLLSLRYSLAEYLHYYRCSLWLWLWHPPFGDRPEAQEEIFQVLELVPFQTAFDKRALEL
ncbi:uncharacterized protein BDZ83DRAFT_305391 [Colletotrichum acutatum]|uniref:Uncharacterized protein n=1 Tax=Glomerella acutata TaxID=27357 RepID=A0AAD8UQG3_GLOAC|nr:uncharacterized protein BDZ83DRAFT_305391 [Colletotrichum acutatum]KAK1725334.1 hypothetical protein BDZ83DRAFT_305391 [Colletotrichum acutatum]